MEDKNIVIVDETTIYEVDGACVEEMRKRKMQALRYAGIALRN